MRFIAWISSNWPILVILLGIAAVVIGGLGVAARGDVIRLGAYAPLVIVTVGGLITLLAPSQEPAKSTWTRIGGAVTLLGAALVYINQAKFERETLAQITGGDSHAFFSTMYGAAPDAEGGVIRTAWWLALRSEGQHPVPDLRLMLTDVTKQGEILAAEFKETGGRGITPRAYTDPEVTRSWDVGITPAPALGPFFHEIRLPDATVRQQYRWIALARNGQTVGEINFAKVDGQWVRAERAVRARKVLPGTEFVDAAFPREPSGDIRWQEFGTKFVPGDVGDPAKNVTILPFGFGSKACQ